MKDYQLAATEEELMHIFWNEDRPLSASEITEIAGDVSWTGSYLHKMLKKLQQKEFLEISGAALHGARFVRQFVPLISKEEYFAGFVAEQGIGMKSLSKFAVALFKKEKMKKGENADMVSDEVIAELKKIIEQIEDDKEPSKSEDK